MDESRSRRLVRSAVEDGVSYVVGLSGVPLPVATLKEAVRIRAERSPANFVDWELRNWHEIYHGEVGNCIEHCYKGRTLRLPQVMAFDNTEKRLPVSSVQLRLVDEAFELKDDIRSLTEYPFRKLLDYLRKRRKYSNEQNLRLVNIVEKRGGVRLEVQPVDYESFVHSNLVLDAKPKHKGQTLRERLHSDGRLEDLAESPLANHLGINILLFTADGSLIMQKRSKVVAFRVKELCPAASGAVSLLDVPTDITLREMPKLREAFEEIGIKRTDVPADQIILLGITRELIRGGKPEIFFFGNTNLSESQVKEKWRDAKDKWEATKLMFFHFGRIADCDLGDVTETHRFLHNVDRFLDQHIGNSSIPLLTSIALWAKHRLVG